MSVFSGDFNGSAVYVNSEEGAIEAADISDDYGTVELPRDPDQLRALAALLIAAADSVVA